MPSNTLEGFPVAALLDSEQVASFCGHVVACASLPKAAEGSSQCAAGATSKRLLGWRLLLDPSLVRDNPNLAA